MNSTIKYSNSGFFTSEESNHADISNSTFHNVSSAGPLFQGKNTRIFLDQCIFSNITSQKRGAITYVKSTKFLNQSGSHCSGEFRDICGIYTYGSNATICGNNIFAADASYITSYFNQSKHNPDLITAHLIIQLWDPFSNLVCELENGYSDDTQVHVNCSYTDWTPESRPFVKGKVKMTVPCWGETYFIYWRNTSQSKKLNPYDLNCSCHSGETLVWNFRIVKSFLDFWYSFHSLP
jgi:hypothetical protein